MQTGTRSGNGRSELLHLTQSAFIGQAHTIIQAQPPHLPFASRSPSAPRTSAPLVIAACHRPDGSYAPPAAAPPHATPQPAADRSHDRAPACAGPVARPVPPGCPEPHRGLRAAGRDARGVQGARRVARLPGVAGGVWSSPPVRRKASRRQRGVRGSAPANGTAWGGAAAPDCAVLSE